MRRLATMGSSRNLSAQRAGRNWLNALSEAAGHRAFFWGLLAVIFIGVLVGHQSLEVIDRDEARFAQASKQMLLSGDLITPYFMDELRAKKPIAIYWVQSASAAIFGHLDIASYRLPSVLGILAALILTYKFAASLWPSTRFLPIIAALLLAATPVMIGEAHLAKTDAVLIAAILCQQFYLWRIYQSHSLSDAEPLGSRLFIGFWAFMAAGILIKGPIAPLVALTTISMLVILDRQVAWLTGLAVFRGSLILAVLTAWVVAVSYQTDGAFLDIAIRDFIKGKIWSGITWRAYWHLFWLSGTVILARYCVYRFFGLAGARNVAQSSQPSLCCLDSWLLAGDRAGANKITTLCFAGFASACDAGGRCPCQPVAPCQPNSARLYSCRLYPCGDLGGSPGSSVPLAGD